MSLQRSILVSACAGIGITMASAALALPVGGPIGALPQGAPRVQTVERVCRYDGYCYNKYTGQPLPPAYRQRVRPQIYPQPYYQNGPRFYQNEPRVYVDPGYVAPRRYYERRDYY